MEIVDGLLSQDYFFAQTFALNAHNKQTRKDKRTPYAAHLLDVASTLMKSDASDSEMIAGWLHDIVEDTPCTLEQVHAIFGQEVGTLVALVSEGDFAPGVQKPNKLERKLAYVGQLNSAPFEFRRSAHLISCADKLSNARDYVHEYQRGFYQDQHTTLVNIELYDGLMRMYRQTLTGTRALLEMEETYFNLRLMWKHPE